MTRDLSSELCAIAADMHEAVGFLADIIDGDVCGGIENESAERDLNMLRARFRSHAVSISHLAFKDSFEGDK